MFVWCSGYQNKLDPTNQAVPFDIDVMLFPKVLSMGRLMRIIKLHNIKRNHSYLILNMLRRANYFLEIVLFLHVFLIPQVKLKMNYHGCVDTLQEECKRWFDKHARDGTNKTARARWRKRSLNNYLVKILMRTTVKRNYKREMVKNTLKVWYLTKSSFRPHLTQSNHP